MHRHCALVLLCKGCTRSAERIQNHLRTHTLHAQLALLGAVPLAAFLARDIGHIRLLDAALRQRALEIVADDKARTVTVGQHNETARFRDTAQQLELVFIVKNAESAAFEHHGVHHLPDGVHIIPALYQNCFPDARHFFSPFSSAAMVSSVSSICFCRSAAPPLSAASVSAHSDAAFRSQLSGTRRAAF